ncbi:MAG: hypothetical protein U0229_05785 [Anaeromyxobacter sp.]
MSDTAAAAVPFPPLEAILVQPRRAALDAFAATGWRPFATPFDLDAEGRRRLNLDLGEPDLAWFHGEDLAAVATLEADREGLVTHVEVVGTEPGDPIAISLALLGPHAGAPKTGGGGEAREWIFGPESGARVEVGGEPVRLWICAEAAYGDRLWLVASVVRRD